MVVPLFDGDDVEQRRDVALGMAADRPTRLTFAAFAALPTQTPPGAVPDSYLRSHREAVERARRAPAGDVPVSGTVRLGRGRVRTLKRFVETEDVEAVVLQHGADETDGRPPTAGRLVPDLDADVAVTNGRGSVANASSVLVGVGGGPHSELAVDVARAVARRTDAWVRLLHVVPEGANDRRRAEADRLLSEAAEGVEGAVEFETWALEADDPAETVVEQAGYHGVTVLGAPTRCRLRQFAFGSTARTVSRTAEAPVVVVRRRPAGGRLRRWTRSDV